MKAITRVPMAQSIEMYRALKSNGVPTRLYLAPREGHQWGELRHLLFKANTELEWFDKYALGRTYVWEKAHHSRSGLLAPEAQRFDIQVK